MDNNNKPQSEFVTFIKKIFVQDLSTAKDSVIDGVVVPQIKSFLSNLSTSLINNILYGKDNIRQNRNGYNYSYNYPVNQVNYSAFNNIQQQIPSQQTQPTLYGIGNLSTINFEPGEGEVILERMKDTISRWGKVSVADFYDLINADRVSMDPPLPRIKFDPMSNNYGWTDLSSARVIRTNTNSFLINFPKVIPLN